MPLTRVGAVSHIGETVEGVDHAVVYRSRLSSTIWYSDFLSSTGRDARYEVILSMREGP